MYMVAGREWGIKSITFITQARLLLLFHDSRKAHLMRKASSSEAFN
jgi:hypothetical protein